ncbi:TonB-dependent receptor [Phenylobacterium sp.]|uniref:TonB-dependent receptor n=1 Tax=Phenylobacterium sp. TaxID=1871053 RepID=UPI00301D2A2A
MSLICSVAATLAGFPTAVLGQAVSQPANDAAQPSEVSEVIVTAQRRAERLEDVPMVVTTVDAASAAQRGVRNLQDLTQITAGVQINNSGFQTAPAVRGVSSLNVGVFFENAIALYIDGFYQDDAVTINQDFANLESIQVLKGPQGTLYGRNATGGAILISTLRPSADFTGKIGAAYSSFNTRMLSGYLSGPLSDRFRFSLAGYGRKSDGYYDLLNAQGAEIGHAAKTHSYSFRAKLEADVTDNLNVTLGYNFTELSDPTGLMFTIDQYRAPTLPPKVGRLYDRRTFATNRNSLQRNTVDEATLTLRWDVGIGQITSYTGAAKRDVKQNFDFDGSFADISYTEAVYSQKNFQQGIDFNIDTIDRLNLIIGATYWDNDVDQPGNNAFTNNAPSSRATRRDFTKSVAAFIDATYELTDKLSVNVGGRYAEEKRESRQQGFIFTNGVATPSSPFATSKLKFSNFSPRGSIRYEVAENTNVYASYSRGFRSGLPQIVVAIGQNIQLPLRPEKIRAFEVGFKTAQRGLQFDIAAYHYKYTDVQTSLQRPNPLNPNTVLSITANAKGAEIYGLDAQTTWQPIDGLTLQASAAYTHAQYEDYSNATGTGLNFGTQRNVGGQPQDWTGLDLARSPQITATFAADYKIMDVFGGVLIPNVNVKYTSSYAPNNPSVFGPLGASGQTRVQRYRQPAFTLVNAGLTWRDADEKVSLGAFVNNVFNTDYRLAYTGSATGDYAFWGSPRVVGIRAGYDF